MSNNRPTATLSIQIPESPTTKLGETTALTQSFEFRIADSETPNGFQYEARISAAIGSDASSPESEITLAVKGLQGLSIREGLLLGRSAPYVELKAGYLDADAPPGTVFYGQLQSLDYDRQGGAVVWELRATGRPIVMFDAEVHLHFPGRHTLGDIWSRVAAALGLRGTVPDAVKDAIVEDWVTSQNGRIEFARLAMEAQAYTLETEGRFVQYVPTQDSVTGEDFRFDLVPIGSETSTPSIEVDLDLIGIHSHGPSSKRTTQPPEPNLDVASTPVATRSQTYSIVSDFDPQVLLGLAVAATSIKEGVAVGFQVEEYQHTIGNGPWKSQLSGTVQVDRSAEVIA